MNKEAKILVAVDRSTALGSFAIFKDGDAVAQETFTEAFPRSPEWFPRLVSVIQALGIDLADVAEYVVGTGPGSFSGIRAVLAAAQGLALPTGAPVWGVLSSSAAAYAEFRRGGCGKIAVLGDARRGTLWLAKCDFTNGLDSDAATPRLIPYTAATAMLEGLDGWKLLSPDAGRIAPILERQGADHRGISMVNPNAADIAAFFLAHPEAAVRDPAPAYLHPAIEKRP